MLKNKYIHIYRINNEFIYKVSYCYYLNSIFTLIAIGINKIFRKNVCICFRGELLRSSKSSHHANTKNKNLVQYNISEDSIKRQNDIMQSIINNIINPYKRKGYNVFVSGCVYKCPEYNENLKKYFPNNTIKQIESGKTNQLEMYYLSIDNAIKNHPNCIEYISLRADYIMLKNIVFKNIKGDYLGISWINNTLPDVDVFFVISKNIIPQFKKILKNQFFLQYAESHYILSEIKKLRIPIYVIWDNYKNAATGMSYNEYSQNSNQNSNRPFVNYMRDR